MSVFLPKIYISLKRVKQHQSGHSLSNLTFCICEVRHFTLVSSMAMVEPGKVPYVDLSCCALGAASGPDDILKTAGQQIYAGFQDHGYVVLRNTASHNMRP
jgi:hypothetical protein